MASYVTPKKNTAFIYYLAGLPSQATPGTFESAPTLAAGDVKVSTDGGVLANITTLPTVTPAAGMQVKISLSAAEMNGDNITVRFTDAAGDEWFDVGISIQTSAQQIDDLATSAALTVIDDFLDTEIAAILADTGTTLDAAIAAVKVDTAAILVDTGTTLDTKINTIDDFLDTEIAAILVDTGTTLDAAIAAVKADTAAILIDTAVIGALGAGLTALATQASVDVIDGIVDSILLDTSEIGAAGVGLTNIGTIAAVTNVTNPVTVGTVNDSASNIKKNTALANFAFVMTDSVTHAPTTGATVTGYARLDAAAFAALANAVTEVANGWYTVDLAAADLNADTIALRFVATGADDTDILIVTQP